MDDDEKLFASEVDWNCIACCGIEITAAANCYLQNENPTREECDELVQQIRDEMDQIEQWLYEYDRL